MKPKELIISVEKKAYTSPLTLTKTLGTERMMALSTTSQNATNNEVLTKGTGSYGNIWDDDE